MNIIENITAAEKEKPGFGIQWGIDAEDYESSLSEDRLKFGDNTEWTALGTTCSTQDILLDNKKIGLLYERVEGGMFAIMHQTFMVWMDHEPTEQERSDPHFYEDEDCWMRFAKLQDMLDYLGIK